MNKNNRLELCPFCGCYPKSYEMKNNKTKRYRIGCDANCGVRPKTAWQTTKKIAISVWNERYEEISSEIPNGWTVHKD